MAVRDKGTRQDTFIVRVTLDGQSLGVWDKKSGGELDSDTSSYRAGGMVKPQNLGGTKTTGNITLSRLYDLTDDHDKINTIFAAVGKGRVSVAQRPMDQDGNEYGKSIIVNGTLKRVSPPEVDSESSSAAMIEIEIQPEGYPVAQ